MDMLGNQYRSLLPAINMTVLKLLDFAKLKPVVEKGAKLRKQITKCVKVYFQMMNKKMPHVQVITSAVQDKLASFDEDGFVKLGKRQLNQTSITDLEHLCLRKDTPKPIPSYDPAIEDEFMLKFKLKGEMDAKTLKKKTKQAEKGAIKELRKDTLAIQE